MANPQHKTCLSVLRSVIGSAAGNEARFAEKIGRSASWLKKASCGQIPLTKDIALRIAYETGISMRWLMQGNTSKTPVDKDDKTFTKATYENYVVFLREEHDFDDAAYSQHELYDCLMDVLRLYVAAQQNNKGGYFTFKLQEEVGNLKKAMGELKIKDVESYNNTGVSILNDLMQYIKVTQSGARKVAGVWVVGEKKVKKLKPQKQQSSVKKAPRKTKI